MCRAPPDIRGVCAVDDDDVGGTPRAGPGLRPLTYRGGRAAALRFVAVEVGWLAVVHAWQCLRPELAADSASDSAAGVDGAVGGDTPGTPAPVAKGIIKPQVAFSLAWLM